MKQRRVVATVWTALYVGVLAAFVAPRAALAVAPNDFWPLVNQAESAVWGTVSSIENGEHDRVIAISVVESVFPDEFVDTTVLRLLEPLGRLPEATPLRPGVSGLFLFHAASSGGEFAAVDGSLIPHGVLAVGTRARERESVGGLLRASDGASRTQSALGLLRSPHPFARAVAVDCLRACESLDSTAADAIRQAFAGEANERVLTAYMDLLLKHDHAWASSDSVAILLAARSAELRELNLLYLEKYATVADQAVLLQSYPGATSKQRVSLLEAYGRLQIEEALPWWESALRSEDGILVHTAIRTIGLAGSPLAQSWYVALLESDHEAIQRMGIRGLATLATPAALAELRRFEEETPAHNPLRAYTGQVVRHPYRFGAKPRVLQN